jgi:hypothetical protein
MSPSQSCLTSRYTKYQEKLDETSYEYFNCLKRTGNVFMCGLRNDFGIRVFAIVLYTMELNRFWRSVFKNILHEI